MQSGERSGIADGALDVRQIRIQWYKPELHRLPMSQPDVLLCASYLPNALTHPICLTPNPQKPTPKNQK